MSMQAKPTTSASGNPSAGDAHLISAAEALSVWIGSHRGEALGGKRVATLMTALAAEAYVNAALLTLVSGSEFKALDKLATPEKFFIGLSYFDPELAPDRSSEPGASLLSLFKTRNALTHSKVPDESAMFVPREQVGKWIAAVAEIVSGWPRNRGGSIPKVFGEYTSHFAEQGQDLANEDAEIQINALADALDACSPFSILFRTQGGASEMHLSVEQTELGEASRAVLWGTVTESHLDPATGKMVEGPPKRVAKP